MPQENIHHLSEKYKNEVIACMLLQLVNDQKKVKTLESAIKGLEDISNDLRVVFNLNTVEINNVSLIIK